MGKEKLKEICADCGQEAHGVKSFVMFLHFKSGTTSRIQTKGHEMAHVVRDFFSRPENLFGLKAFDILEF